MAEFKIQRQNAENGNKETCKGDFGVGRHKLMIESLKIILFQSNLLVYILLWCVRLKQNLRKSYHGILLSN